MSESPTKADDLRSIPIAGYIGIVIVYLLIVQGVGLLMKPEGIGYGELPDTNAVWRTITLPVGLSLLFGVAIVSALRWWQPVWRDDRPVSGWVKIVPALLVLSILVTTDYVNILDQSGDLVLLLLASLLLVGAAEEMMFRGIGVVAFRQAGYVEARVALWTSVIFGAVHMTNVFTEGPGAFMQAVIVSFTGYFLYLSRRSLGLLLAPMLIHGLYDFSIFSHMIGVDKLHAPAQTVFPILMLFVIGGVVVAKRKSIEIDSLSSRPMTRTKPTG